MGDSITSLSTLEISNILSSPLIHQARRLVMEGYQLG